MPSPKLSVVMPTKNRSNYLAQSINSIQKQTFKNWELIVVDDHSTENIRKIIESFKDKRIKYFRLKKGTGIAAARNFGNRQAKAPIIIVADSDDPSYPNRLKITYDYFQKHPKTDVFYSNLDILYLQKNQKTTRWFQPYKQELIYQINFIPHPASAYKKKTFQKISGYDQSLIISADYDLWLKFSDINAEFGCSKKSLVLLQIHTTNISKQKGSLLKNHIKKIRKNHNIKKSDISKELVKKLAAPAVYKVFTKPFGKKTWFTP